MKKCTHVKIILKNLKSYTEKKTKHIPSGYSLFTHCSFDATKNKLDCYRGKDCKERFRKEHAIKVSDCEKKEMISLTDKENKSLLKNKNKAIQRSLSLNHKV